MEASPYTNLGNNWAQEMYDAYKTDCRGGDGISGTETSLSGTFTKENCIIAVREQYPTANGATMDANCPSKCRCFAEFGMTHWSGSSFQSCMFIGGECCMTYTCISSVQVPTHF